MPIGPEAHSPRVNLPRCPFSQLSICLKGPIALLPHCLFHQNQFIPSAHSPRCPFGQCSTAHLPQVQINNTTRSRHCEHYSAEWSAHWTASLVSSGRCSAKLSTMMHILHYKKIISKKYICSKFREWVIKSLYGVSLLITITMGISV